MMKKRITAILAAAIIAVGASIPAFADSDFNTAGCLLYTSDAADE